MKRILTVQVLAIAFTFSLLFALPFESTAKPPAWAPAHGYRAKTRHIYFPGYNIYFDLIKNLYSFKLGGVWKSAPRLPLIYAALNLKNAHKIELDFTGDNPHRYNAKHMSKYKGKDFKVVPNTPGHGNGASPGKWNKAPHGGHAKKGKH